MRWLVHPESRMAVSDGVGTRVLKVMLQWCFSLLFVPSLHQALFLVDLFIVLAAFARAWCPAAGVGQYQLLCSQRYLHVQQ
jgi:hypothetical protein